MKNKKLKKNPSELSVTEMKDGKIQGGFEIVYSSHLLVAFGGDETNNCDGGNCAAGCAQTNTKEGCGGTVNAVAGCGAIN